ncbi:MAG: adenosylmethionine--8-amino-7-oxononanoate transaminase [Alphaproteobacteria bacterium]
MKQLSAFLEQDQRLIWHPFTQEKNAPLPILIEKGSEVHLYDADGKAYLDLISSWWVNLHGHGCPAIAEAIYAQALELEQVIFAGFTHKPAITLCQALGAILPASLSKYFFSDNGSTAVEVALKMAYQFWWNQGEPQRRLFLSFEGAYHGDTFGAMSVGRTSGFHAAFQDFLFETATLPFPATWEGDETVAQKEEAALEQLETLLKKQATHIAGMILEPLVQGASGMRCCRPSFLNRLMALLKAHGILILFDEVMTGFGRTGTTFAYEQLEHVPDILCLSKGLTGGFLPLALTVASQSIYEAFLGDTFSKALAHGHSYTANPLGCAAAIASLNLLQSPQTQQQLADLAVAQRKGVQYLQEAIPERIHRVRSVGTIAAFEWREPLSSPNSSLQRLKQDALEAGFLIRPLGQIVYLLPPYCISLEALESVYRWLAHYGHDLG